MRNGRKTELVGVPFVEISHNAVYLSDGKADTGLPLAAFSGFEIGIRRRLYHIGSHQGNRGALALPDAAQAQIVEIRIIGIEVEHRGCLVRNAPAARYAQLVEDFVVVAVQDLV